MYTGEKKKVTHFRRKLSMYFLKAFTSLSTGNWALSGMTIATRHLPVLILRKRSTCAHRCQLKATKRWLRWGGGGDGVNHTFGWSLLWWNRSSSPFRFVTKNLKNSSGMRNGRKAVTRERDVCMGELKFLCI